MRQSDKRTFIAVMASVFFDRAVLAPSRQNLTPVSSRKGELRVDHQDAACGLHACVTLTERELAGSAADSP
jgi:hypothetical protein